jgi:hypothetical protein
LHCDACMLVLKHCGGDGVRALLCLGPACNLGAPEPASIGTLRCDVFRGASALLWWFVCVCRVSTADCGLEC